MPRVDVVGGDQAGNQPLAGRTGGPCRNGAGECAFHPTAMPAAPFSHGFADDRKAFLEGEEAQHGLARVFVALHQHARGRLDVAWRRLAERVFQRAAEFDELADQAIFRSEVQEYGRDRNGRAFGDLANRDLVIRLTQVQISRGVQNAIACQRLPRGAGRHAIGPGATRHIKYYAYKINIVK